MHPMTKAELACLGCRCYLWPSRRSCCLHSSPSQATWKTHGQRRLQRDVIHFSLEPLGNQGSARRSLGPLWGFCWRGCCSWAVGSLLAHVRRKVCRRASYTLTGSGYNIKIEMTPLLAQIAKLGATQMLSISGADGNDISIMYNSHIVQTNY